MTDLQMGRGRWDPPKKRVSRVSGNQIRWWLPGDRRKGSVPFVDYKKDLELSESLGLESCGQWGHRLLKARRGLEGRLSS